MRDSNVIRVDTRSGVMNVTCLWNDGTNLKVLSSGTDSIVLNKWQHIAFTFKSGEQKVYIDGILKNTGTRADTITYSATNWHFGKQRNSGAMFYNGLIDNPQIFNKVLSQSDIKRVMMGLHPFGG